MEKIELRYVALMVCLLIGHAFCEEQSGPHAKWFTGKDSALQPAIDQDDVRSLHAALAAGASVNAKGRVGVNPLEYALGHFKKQTYQELLKLHADPNQMDQEGDNAVTLGMRAYRKDPVYLDLALKAGGNPNTRTSDGDPILVSAIAARNIPAIQYLSKSGADINARDRTGRPLIVEASLTQDWDVVWCLLQLGAHYDYTGEIFTVAAGFKNFKATPPDSPLYDYKRRSYQFLEGHGIALPPLLPK